MKKRDEKLNNSITDELQEPGTELLDLILEEAGEQQSLQIANQECKAASDFEEQNGDDREVSDAKDGSPVNRVSEQTEDGDVTDTSGSTRQDDNNTTVEGIQSENDELPTEGNLESPVEKKLDSILETVNSQARVLKMTFETKLLMDAQKDKIIDTMHKELQEYKDDMFTKIFNPILADIIGLKEDLNKMRRNLSEKEPEYFTKGKLLSTLESYEYDVSDLLEKYGVEIFQGIGDDYIPVKQRIIKLVENQDQELDNKIAQRLSNGYILNGKVISPEKVTVYKYKNQQ